MAETTADWQILVDREICMGSGMCIVYAPNTFAHDDETKAVVQDHADESVDMVRTAVDACPTGALRLLPREREV